MCRSIRRPYFLLLRPLLFYRLLPSTTLRQKQTTQEVEPLGAEEHTPAQAATTPESVSISPLDHIDLLEQPVQLTRSTSHPVEARRVESGTTGKTALPPTQLAPTESPESKTNDDEERWVV